MGAAVLVSFLSPATDGPRRSALPLPLPRFCLLRVSLATAPAGFGVGFLLSLCGSFKGLDMTLLRGWDAVLQLAECPLLYLFASRWHGGFCRMASAHVSIQVTSAVHAPAWFGRPLSAHVGCTLAFSAHGSRLWSSWGHPGESGRLAAARSGIFGPPPGPRSVASSPILGLAKLALGQGSHVKGSARTESEGMRVP